MNRTDINHLIIDGQLFKASQLLQAAMQQPAMEGLEHQLKEQMAVYQNMVKYMMQGVVDTQQEQVLTGIKKNMLSISDGVYRLIRMENSSDQYYLDSKVCRNYNFFDELFQYDKRAIEAPLESDDRAYYDRLSRLYFDWLWVSDSLSDNMSEKISKSSEYLRRMSACAIALGLFRFWDIGKVQFVLSELQRQDISLEYRIRLFFALVVVLQTFPERCELYHDMFEAHLPEIDKHIPIDKLFHSLLYSYIMTFSTPEVTRTIERKMPNIWHATQNEQIQNIINDLQDDSQISGIDEENAELQQVEQDIKEISELEESGLDTLYATFKNTKNDAFFNDIASWFTPFDTRHSRVRSIIAQSDILKKLLPLLEQRFCDSDLYSLVFGMGSMQVKLGVADGNLDMVSEQLKELNNSLEMQSVDAKLTRAAGAFMQDLFRFISLYRGNTQKMPYYESIPQTKMKLLKPYVNFTEMLQVIVDGLKGMECEAEALPFYKLLIEQHPDNDDYLLRYGVLLCNIGEVEQGIKYIEAADAIKDLSRKDVFFLAKVYASQHNYKRCIELYNRYRKDVSVLPHLAACLIAQSNYEEAIAVLHEYAYLSGKEQRAARSLAWCYFMQKNYEKSMQYYEKIDKMTPIDYLNKGYCYLAMNSLPNAMESFVKAFSLTKEPSKLFDEAQRDSHTLEQNDISKSYVHLLLDAAYMHYTETL